MRKCPKIRKVPAAARGVPDSANRARCSVRIIVCTVMAVCVAVPPPGDIMPAGVKPGRFSRSNIRSALSVRRRERSFRQPSWITSFHIREISGCSGIRQTGKAYANPATTEKPEAGCKKQNCGVPQSLQNTLFKEQGIFLIRKL